MKYVVVLCDGMADLPYEKLDNKTPLEVAYKPNIDFLASKSICGLVKTVPNGLKPGSDVANLAMMGYKPDKYYSGRSPLEALSMGINLDNDDLAIRCNLVTLSNEEVYEDKTMLDYSAGEISTAEAKELIESVERELGSELYNFYAGVSYRHCLVAKHSKVGTIYTPPHDILDRPIKEYLPKGLYGDIMLDFMKKSWNILVNHPINQKRISEGKNPANSIWLWGEGTKPILPKFSELYGKKGGVISAVDLLKGIGIAGDMEIIEVDGVTGTIDTNFEGKAKACVDSLKSGLDYVYLHMEAPDECGHQGDYEGKVKSIEIIDKKVIRYLMEELKDIDYTMLIAPDHPTPLKLRTHTSEKVPFMIYTNTKDYDGIESYTELNCSKTGIDFEDSNDLVNLFFKGGSVMFDKESNENNLDSKEVGMTTINEKLEENGQEVLENEASPKCDMEEDVIINDIGDSEEIEEEQGEGEPQCEVVESTLDKKAQKKIDKEQKKREKELKRAEKKKNKEKAQGVASEEDSQALDNTNDNENNLVEQKKDSRIKDFFENHKIFIIVTAVILVLAVVASILTPILVINHPKQFVKSAEDFSNVKEHKEYYVLNDDLTINGDVTMVIGMDMNGKSLKVNGTLTIKNARDYDLFIGDREKNSYVSGGKIYAKKIIIEGSTNNIYASLIADDIEVKNVKSANFYNDVQFKNTLSVNSNSNATFNKVVIDGDNANVKVSNSTATFNGEVLAPISADNGKVNVNTASLNVNLDMASELRVQGTIYADKSKKNLGTINGGKLVFMKEGAKAGIIKDTALVWLDKNNAVDLINVKQIEYIKYLQTPVDASVSLEGEKVVVNVPKVEYATRVSFTINDAKEPIIMPIAESNDYDLTPYINKVGTYKITVVMLPDKEDEEFIVASDPLTITYNHIITLDKVTNARVELSGGEYILKFNAVNFANAYIIEFDSYRFIYKTDAKAGSEVSYNFSQDKVIKDMLTVGSHMVRVTATNTSDSNIKDSAPTIAEFAPIIGNAGKPELKFSVNQDGSYNLTWNKTANTIRYEIYVDGVRYANTTKNEWTLSKDLKDKKVYIVAVGEDGYKDTKGDEVTLS